MAIPSECGGVVGPRYEEFGGCGHPDQNIISEYPPAAGTSAAVNWRDYGRPRWQLPERIQRFLAFT
jgi:hypothetical protein